MRRAVDIRDRTRRLTDQGMSATAAAAQATAEAGEDDRARVTGLWRDTLKDGFRSALDGNVGDWLKNWWQDKVAKGLEGALNSLADLIANLFAKAGNGAGGGGGGGGGLLGTVTSVLGGLFGGGGAGAAPIISAPMMPIALPGFATGGSFRVGGMSGIDRNVVAFRASKGEMVDIRKPGAERTAGDTPTMSLVLHNDFRGSTGDAVPAINAKLDKLRAEIPAMAVAATEDYRIRQGRNRG